MVDSVTPLACLISTVTVGGTPVTPVPANPLGGFLQNPQAAEDQGIAIAEVMYVDPVGVPGSAPGAANGTCFAIYPGGSWPLIPGQTTTTRVNAASSGHKFSGVYWK